MEKDKSWTTPPKEEEQRRVRRKPINRQQLLLRPVEVEKLVDPGHPVRAIWELVGRLNLEPFYAEIESVEGVAGRPVWDPQLLISLWLYAYKDGVSPDFHPQAFEYDASTDCCRCPGGKGLLYETEEREGASLRRRYRARASDCRVCAFQAQCCPGTKRGRSLVRSEATPEMVAFQAKMETPEAQAIYKQRAGVAEFPNAWIKDKIGLRQFRLRGLVKVTFGALWACLAYNICQWIRLCWKPQRLAQA
jgi:hypothetical protein